MIDARFHMSQPPMALGELAERAGARLYRGDPASLISTIKPLDLADSGSLSFFENPRYAAQLRQSNASACLLHESAVPHAPEAMALLLTERPRRSFARLARVLHPPRITVPGQHPSAVVDAAAKVDPGAEVGPLVHIAAGAEISAGVRIDAGAVIGAGVVIGADSVIGANAVVEFCLIGARVVIYPGACVGQTGFGFDSDPDGIVKVPHLGRVIIADDVEIGANTTVDRGSAGDTVIGRGTMIDNQVQIGHNCVTGKGCIIVAQAGLAGSARLGDYVVLGGKAGVAGHIAVGDFVQAAGGASITKSVAAGAKVSNVWPATDIGRWRRQVAAFRRLTRKG